MTVFSGMGARSVLVVASANRGDDLVGGNEFSGKTAGIVATESAGGRTTFLVSGLFVSVGVGIEDRADAVERSLSGVGKSILETLETLLFEDLEFFFAESIAELFLLATSSCTLTFCFTN